MTIRVLLFDLDDTLYSPDSGLMPEVGKRIKQYMLERMGMPWERVIALRDQYLKQYGTTLRGLILHHDVDRLDYLEYVHDIDLSRFIQPNPRLADALAELETENVIFTNATAKHARRVLDVVSVSGYFDRIIDVADVEYVGKPDPSAYVKALRMLEATPSECAIFEDMARNLYPAAAMGMTTVLVGRPPEAGIDYTIPEIADVARVVARMNGSG